MNLHFLLAFLTGFAIASNSVGGYKRTLIYTKNVNVNTNTVENNIDPHHNRLQAFGGGHGLYTQTEADALLPIANSWFVHQFGLNFTNGTYDPVTDAWTLPGVGIMFPFITGADYQTRLDYDSDVPKIGKSEEWILLVAGHVVLLQANGVFPGGVMFNTTYTVGDILGCNDQNHLNTARINYWSVPGDKGRRKWFVRSKYPSRQLVNNFGKVETFVKDALLDDKGNWGLVVGSVVTLRNDDGSITQSSRHLMTFDKPGYMPPIPPIPSPL